MAGYENNIKTIKECEDLCLKYPTCNWISYHSQECYAFKDCPYGLKKQQIQVFSSQRECFEQNEPIPTDPSCKLWIFTFDKVYQSI